MGKTESHNTAAIKVNGCRKGAVEAEGAGR